MIRNEIIVLFLLSISQLFANTSISDGNWNNASIWSAGHVPNGVEDVVVEHTIVVNDNLYFTNDAVIEITQSGVLNSDDQGNRTIYLALNAILINNGIIDLYEIDCASEYNTVKSLNNVNSGTIILEHDLLLSGKMINNAQITIERQLSNSGWFENNGNVDVGDDLNTSSVFLNSGDVKISFDYNNSGHFTNNQDGKVTVVGEANNSDTIVNNGIFKTLDINNSGLMNGNGSFCISGISTNSGTIIGYLTVCDITPSSSQVIDANIGIIGENVSACSSGSCEFTTSISDENSSNILVISTSDGYYIANQNIYNEFNVRAYSVQGVLKHEQHVYGGQIFNMEIENGIFYLSVFDESTLLTTVKLYR